jgi:hypothetical protein
VPDWIPHTSPGFASSVSAAGSGSPTAAETEPIAFGVHSEVAEPYGVDPDKFPPHATTLDYGAAAAGG